MFWYMIITGLVSIVITIDNLAVNRKRSIQGFSLFCTFAVLFFFMAARASYVGIDTREYVRAFEQIKDFRFTEVFTKPVYGLGLYYLDLEPGYRLFNWIVGILFKNNQAIIVAGSVAILSLLYLIIIKRSPFPLLSVWMYLTLGIFQTEMNISRNAIAILICYLAEDAVTNKNLKKYLIIVAIACSFHLSAVIFIPVYFLVNNIKMNRKTIIILLFVAIIIMLLLPTLRGILVRIAPYRFRRYLLNRTRDYSALIVGAFYYFLFALILLFMRRDKVSLTLQNENFGTWLFVLNTMIFIMGINLYNAARAAAIFGPYLIVYIPRLIEQGVTGKKRVYARVAVYMICLVQYIGRLMINNIGSTMPYQFFWNS